jgi:hypothetical protein
MPAALQIVGLEAGDRVLTKVDFVRGFPLVVIDVICSADGIMNETCIDST